MTQRVPYKLTPAQIDAIVEALRAAPGDHIRRGKIGNGYAYEHGVFRQIWVEEEIYDHGPFADEAAFRAHLAALDLAARENLYRFSVFEQLGVLPANALLRGRGVR